MFATEPRIEWHSEGPRRAGIAPAENEKGNSDKKEKAPEDVRGIFNHRLKSVAGERSPQHQQERNLSLHDQRVRRCAALAVPGSQPAQARAVAAYPTGGVSPSYAAAICRGPGRNRQADKVHGA